MSCPVVSSPLDSHFSRSSKQYWPQGHPLTNIQWIVVKRNRLWVWVFPLNNHRRGDREVKQSSNCQLRQWSEKTGRERGRETGGKWESGVYKQTPCNKFVFSRCQVPWPSLRLSVRSILFGLACAWAAAINFTECYEPLIRLANGACNLAEAKPTVLWIADTPLQWLKRNCDCSEEQFVCEVPHVHETIWLCDCECVHLYRSVCVTVWIWPCM